MPRDPLRINLWSGPRNVSTALMYSFAARSDTRVVDEPLYAHYLRVSRADHPGREEVLAAMETDGEKVVRELILGPCDRPVHFFKQMAHHLVDLDRGFLDRTVNVLLIRDPADVVRSLRHQLPHPTLGDTGFAVQSELFDELRDRGQAPPVLESRELLSDPRAVLTELCGRLGLPFEESMLGWEAGGRPEDGIWAPHWYANVQRSTGFGPYVEKTEPVPAELEPLVAACRPHYERLFAAAIRAPRNAGEPTTASAPGPDAGSPAGS